jgi:tetratricopeptide (TPR) repeat protein
MLTVEQLFHRLDHAFRLLTDGVRTALPRQQTLRATIDWSYQLLVEKERILLLRLSVFAGGCTLDGAEAIGCGNGLEADEIFELLASLVNKSLVDVKRWQDQEARYNLLETVRQYTREKLHDTGESASQFDRHLAYYVQFADTGYRLLMTEKRLEWTKRLTEELANLRTAVDWAYTGGENPESGLRIAASLGFRFMPSQGYAEEAMRWLRTGLAKVDSTKISDLLHVKALIALEWILSVRVTQYEERSAILEEAIQLCCKIGSQANPERVYALGRLGWYKKGLNEVIPLWDEALEIAADFDHEHDWIHANLLIDMAYVEEDSYNNWDVACQYAESALRLFSPEGSTDRWSSAHTHHVLGICGSRQGKVSEGRMHLEKALALFQESGDNVGFAQASCGLTIELIRQNAFDEAIYHNDHAMQTWHLVGREIFTAIHIGFLGIILANVGSRPDALSCERCFAQAVTFMSIADSNCPPDIGYYRDINRSDAEKILHDHLSAADYATAWAEGQSMTLEAGVALATKIAEEWNVQA